MQARIDQLARFSTDRGGGVTRLPFTREMEQAYALLADWMRAAGLSVRRDAAHNLIGRREGLSSGLPTLMIGSHLDSVIHAGKYDGVLGLVVALEVMRVLHEQGVALRHPLEIVAFCDEEGVRFQTPQFGSRAMVGRIDLADLRARDRQGVSLAAAMRTSGLDPADLPRATRQQESLLAYLEVHIEQGPILDQLGQACGVVTGIAGMTRYRFAITGTPGHAGTVPMAMRRDALAGAAEVVLAVERVAHAVGGLLATVGDLAVLPGAANVIPGAVEGVVDLRHLVDAERKAACAALRREIRTICRRRGLSCRFHLQADHRAVACSRSLISLIHETLTGLGLDGVRLASGAGHDAAIVADLTPMGMIFVRCHDGISHHAAENVSPEDMESAAHALFHVVCALAG